MARTYKSEDMIQQVESGRCQTQRPHNDFEQRGSCIAVHRRCLHIHGFGTMWPTKLVTSRQKPIWNTELLLIKREDKCTNELFENTSHLLVPTLSDNDNAADDDNDDDDNESLYTKRHPSENITQAG